jgi:RNA polymerase sigma-70 factor (ECF subfamily)
MDNPRITEKEIGIIKRAQAGDKSAFNWIYKRYKGFVTHVLNHYLNDYDEAKDIANVVFLKVHKKLSTFVEYDSFGGWLRIITNRVAIDYIRKQKQFRRMKSLDSEDYRLWSKDQLTPDADLVNRQTYGEVIENFKMLPKKHQEIMRLFYVENLTVPQIVDAMNMSKGTVKSILSRSRKKLKQTFSK